MRAPDRLHDHDGLEHVLAINVTVRKNLAL